MATRTLTRYIPQNAIERPHPAGLGTVYLFTNPAGRLAAMGYIGKQSKSVFHYSFGTEAQREAYIAQWFGSLDKTAAMKQEFAAMRAAAHTLQVGDVVYNSWGWEQTNIDFYQVVKTSANYVWLRPIAAHLDETADLCGTSSMSGYKRPIKDQFIQNGAETQHRVKMLDSGPFITFKYGAGCVYQGRSVYCSWYG